LADEADTLLPTMAAVARSVEYVDFERPVDQPVPEHGRDVTDPHLGFTIRQPAGWVGAQTHRGFTMGQFDCLQGGVVTPSAEVIVLDLSSEHTAESFGRQAIEAKAEEGQEITVLSHGPTEMANANAYEFVIKKDVPTADGRPGESWIEIGRLIVIRGTGGRQRLYALVVRCRSATPRAAMSVMDAIAPTFSLSAPSE